MKTEVYSWRISPDLKTDLEAEARRENLSVSALLDRLACEWLAERRAQSGTDEAVQARLHRAAEKWFGAIRGGGAARPESVRTLVRERLKRRHERSRSH
jgi:hypothetical protein